MKHTFVFSEFEIELPSEDSFNEYYDVELEVVADVDYDSGSLRSLGGPGSPSSRTIEIVSYKVVTAGEEAGPLGELNKRLQENPLPSLDGLHELIWEDYLIMQEDARED